MIWDYPGGPDPITIKSGQWEHQRRIRESSDYGRKAQKRCNVVDCDDRRKEPLMTGKVKETDSPLELPGRSTALMIA